MEKAFHSKKLINFKRFRESGFTLIELMVVIVILGILAGLIVPNIMDNPDKAKKAKAQVQIENFSTALHLYKLDNGKYPTTQQGLQALAEPSANNNNKKYIDKIPNDPWKNEYIYLSPGIHGDFDIICYGADGVPEGDGANEDIKSWEIE